MQSWIELSCATHLLHFALLLYLPVFDESAEGTCLVSASILDLLAGIVHLSEFESLHKTSIFNRILGILTELGCSNV